MLKKSTFTGILIATIISSNSVEAINEVAITENGRVATFKMPLRAIISEDMTMRETIDIIPLSSLYENATWDTISKKFKDHELLLRVKKSERIPVLFEIINDQYTCSYNNPAWKGSLSQPTALAGVNTGYTYTLLWNENSISVPKLTRSALVDGSSLWQKDLEGYYFLDLKLRIGFPVVSGSTSLMNKGGFCSGSISILISRTF
ncbi:hypothetical protein CRD82_01780 [Escherichia coli]|uniref:hypothetical protein n=1 Tax=Escherichia coli TaxID=562 RepID=UPI000E35206A|nr:hypothetical protein [Escherichia coli]EEV3841309.1 hypothetical protein [Escherichia coli]EEX2797651.1 hypothetical protein [Escherichia coli]EEZ5340255.1 hypothetical protein [Escherichia coli]EFL6174274.1 hypothetical protein [Escherichia coli]EFU6057332.1 hypothetical protein [Escherichia coli]